MSKKKLMELIKEMTLYINHTEECQSLSIGHELRGNVLHKVHISSGECDCGFIDLQKKLNMF